MKKITFLTRLLFCLFLSLSINAQTIDFNSGTGLADDNDFGDDEITVGNYKFVYSQDAWFGSTNGYAGTMSLSADTSDLSPGQSQYVSVETLNGNEFDFQSFWLDVISFNGSENWTLEGFKDGSSIGTQVISVTGGPGGYIQTVTPNSTFDDIDKVTITAGNTGYFKRELFDNFVFGTAVSADTAPTAISVTFSGTLQAGEVLTSSYSYADVDSDAETNSTYKWYASDDTAGTGKSQIASTKDVTLTVAQIGNYISFEVTPVNANASGSAVESSIQGPVDKKTPTITFVDILKTHGEANFDLSAVTNSSGTLSYSIIAGGTGTASLLGLNNKTVAIGNAGTLTIRASLTPDAEYMAATKDITLTIDTADVIITVDVGQTKVYGATDPTLNYSISGFVNGDTEANLDTGVSISRAAGEVVGAYTITPSAAADSNYSVSFITADFSITAASLTITGLTEDNKVFDGTTNATASGTPVLSGVVSDNDVVLGGTPVFTFASAELGTDIQITTTGFIITGADSGNYNLTQPTLSADIVTTLGVDDITDVKFSLILYPNPAINYIRVLGFSEKANYSIYNLLGKKVGKGIVENDEDITIQNLSNGTYFIIIENAKAIKFIKM